MTKKIFKAQTSEGYTIKVLADLLQNNIKTACLMLDESGCRLTMYDSHRRVCFSFFLEATNFQIYKFKPINSLYLGLNLGHFYKMIKSISRAKLIGPLLIGLGLPIEIAPLRSSTSDIINLASIAAYSADVIDYNKD